MALVSVLITTYNGSKYIEKQLESIINQSVLPDEVIIIDDGSSDDTIEKIKKFIDIHSLRGWSLQENKINKGWKRNFMEGSQLCSNDYVFFCDQDDIWKPNKIECLLNYLLKNKNIDVICSDFEDIDENGIYIKEDLSRSTKKDKLESVDFNLVNYYPLRMGCTFAVKNIFLSNAFNYWHHNSAHDAFLWRLSSLKETLYILHESLIDYRQHSGGASKKKLNYDAFLDDIKYQVMVNDILMRYAREQLDANDEKIDKILTVSSFFKKRYGIFSNRNLNSFLSLFFVNHPCLKFKLKDFYKFMFLK